MAKLNRAEIHGENKALKEQIQQLRLQNEIAIHKLQLSTSQQQINIQESLAYAPDFGSLVNPLAQLFDGNRPIWPLFPSRWDYRLYNSGIWVTDAQRLLINMYARYMADTNMAAKAVLKGKCNYVIRQGYSYDVDVKRGRRVSDGLLEIIRGFLDDWQEKNQWCLRQPEIYRRTHRDGESFIRLFPQDDGVAEVRMIEPEQVMPPSGDASPEWLFGVHVEEDDKEKVLGYNVILHGDLNDSEDVPPEQVVHIKVNTDLIIRRGLSSLFCPMDSFQQTAKLLKAVLMGESCRQAIAYIREHQQANQQTIQTLQNLNTDFNIPLLTQNGQSRLQPVQEIVPGAVHDIPEGMSYKGAPMVAGSGENGQAALALAYQALSAVFQTPQWLISGNADESNFAQALVAESPFVRECESEQEFFGYHYKLAMMKSLQIAEEQGVLPEGTCAKIKLIAKYPPVAVRDPLKNTERNLKLKAAGVMSKRTMAVNEELDYDHELEQGAVEEVQAEPKTTESQDEYKRQTEEK